MKKYAGWTEEQELFLIREWGLMTSLEIAELIGKEREQVVGKVAYMRKIGYPMRPGKRILNPSTREADVEFIKSNIEMTPKNIAKELGKSANYIRVRLREIKKEMGAEEKEAIAIKVREANKLEAQKRKEERKIIRDRERQQAFMKEKEAADKKEEKEVQAIYDNIINESIAENEELGVFKAELEVEVGKKYIIEKTRNKSRVKHREHFIGELIQETKSHITLKSKVRTESFLKVDILMNEYTIKEVA